MEKAPMSPACAATAERSKPRLTMAHAATPLTVWPEKSMRCHQIYPIERASKILLLFLLTNQQTAVKAKSLNNSVYSLSCLPGRLLMKGENSVSLLLSVHPALGTMAGVIHICWTETGMVY